MTSQIQTTPEMWQSKTVRWMGQMNWEIRSSKLSSVSSKNAGSTCASQADWTVHQHVEIKDYHLMISHISARASTPEAAMKIIGHRLTES